MVAACGGAATPSPHSAVPSGGASPAIGCVAGSIIAAGSTALQPLVEAAARQYVAACVGSRIQVDGGGSATGLDEVSRGAVQIGDSDLGADSTLSPSDAGALTDHIVAIQGWIMIASKDVTGVTNLTTSQARRIWTGAVTDWKDVGGPDEPIVLILRPTSSGTRATFRRIVLGGTEEATGQALTEDTNAAVATAVRETPGSTSVIGFAYYEQNRSTLTGFALDGVDPTVANLAAGAYKLQAEGHMFTKGEPSGLTKAFLDYMSSSDVQGGLVPSLFFAPVVK